MKQIIAIIWPLLLSLLLALQGQTPVASETQQSQTQQGTPSASNSNQAGPTQANSKRRRPSASREQRDGAPLRSRLLDAAQLLGDVRVLADDSMEGREAGAPGGARARASVVGRFRELGLKPFGASFEHPFQLKTKGSAATSQQGANVVGYIEGRSQAQRYIVVSAHYDHVGIKGGQVYNGADDNASGVAALLAMAAYFKHHQPSHTLVFAAFDAEEIGLQGARAFVAAPPVERNAIVLNVNLDMVSHSERGEIYAAGASAYPFLRPLLEQVAAHAPAKLLLGHDRPVPTAHDDWTEQSDQAEFNRAGIPFVYFGVEDHKDYHQPTDDFDTITPQFFVHAAETILDAVRLFDAKLIGTERGRTPQKG